MKKLFNLLVIPILLLTLLAGGCSPFEPAPYTNSRFVDVNGTPYGVPQVEGKPRVSSMPYTFDIAEGHIDDHVALNKFGHNPTVAGSLETVWTGSNLYPWMTVADQLEILSSDPDDAAGDTGARSLILFGLDVDYLLISEVIITDGINVVTSVLTYFRIYRVMVVEVGVSGWNEGQITIRDQDTDTARALIEVQKNQTLMATFTIPANYTGFITSWYVGSVTTKDTEFELYIRPFGEAFQVKRNIHLVGMAYSNRFDFPEVASGRSDIEIRASSSGGGGDVSAGFFLWYEGN